MTPKRTLASAEGVDKARLSCAVFFSFDNTLFEVKYCGFLGWVRAKKEVGKALQDTRNSTSLEP